MEGSIKQGHGDAAGHWCSVAVGVVGAVGRTVEKSVPCIREQVVRNMQTAESKLRKKARKRERRLIGRRLQSRVRKGLKSWLKERGNVVTERGGDGRRK